jgi:hypothetical protein
MGKQRHARALTRWERQQEQRKYRKEKRAASRATETETIMPIGRVTGFNLEAGPGGEMLFNVEMQGVSNQVPAASNPSPDFRETMSRVVGRIETMIASMHQPIGDFLQSIPVPRHPGVVVDAIDGPVGQTRMRVRSPTSEQPPAARPPVYPLSIAHLASAFGIPPQTLQEQPVGSSSSQATFFDSDYSARLYHDQVREYERERERIREQRRLEYERYQMEMRSGFIDESSPGPYVPPSFTARIGPSPYRTSFNPVPGPTEQIMRMQAKVARATRLLCDSSNLLSRVVAGLEVTPDEAKALKSRVDAALVAFSAE